MTNAQKMFTIIGFLAAVCIVVIVALAPRAAHAQGAGRCAKHSEIIKGLADKFHETGVGVGVAGEQGLVELYVAKDGKTWSILSVGTNGIACFLATGDDWMDKAAVIEGSNT